MYYAICMDISKVKSTVAVLLPGGVIALECTDRYCKVMANTFYDAGLFVFAINPHIIKTERVIFFIIKKISNNIKISP